MTVGEEPRTGEPDDRVRIHLGNDQDVRIVESYDFQSSILQQPSAFSLDLSGGRGAAELLKKYPPGPIGACRLTIGGKPQFSGELDAPNAHGDHERTTVSLKGRDMMKRLVSDITGERSFSNATYKELFEAALADCGLKGRDVKISNKANVLLRSGVKVKAWTEPVSIDEVSSSGSGGATRNLVTAKLGETWIEFLERHLAKQGLFMWCDAEGNFVLSRPNGEQSAHFHFYRKRGPRSSVANVKSWSFTNDTTLRFSEVVVFARGTGRKHGHNHTHGGFVDEEMLALGIQQRRVYRDAAVTSEKEAEFYARKKIAEANRAAWKLQYVISGHSAPLMNEPGKRGVIAPDMVARVDDDDLGIHQNLYIEAVSYRSPPRTTVITLMRPQDLVFGENQATAGAEKAKAAAKAAEQKRKKVWKLLTFERTRAEENSYTNLQRSLLGATEKPPT